MSSDLALVFDHVCYVHCNFCNTILAVSVPCNLHNIVTVRCGHCASLLSVNLASLIQTVIPPQIPQINNKNHQDFGIDYASSLKDSRIPLANSFNKFQDPILPMRPPDHQKRQRAPSAYNRFIKEEIQRIKANNPEISHREAFSAAAKNWAHLPRIHFELKLEANKQLKIDAPIAADGMGKARAFY